MAGQHSDEKWHFFIDRGGTIRHVFSSQILATKHVGEALAVVKRLTS